MMFDEGRRDGVKDTAWCFYFGEDDHIVPYTTAGDFSGGGNGSYFPFNKKGVGGNYIDVRGGEQETFRSEDAFPSSSFTSPMDLGSSFCEGGLPDWTLGMDPMPPVPEFDDSKWSSCGMYLSGSTSSTYVGSAGEPGGYVEGQGSFSELGHSSYVSEGNEPIAVDNSFSLSMDGRMELDNNSGMSVNGYEDCSDCFLGCDWSSISNFDDPEGIFSDSTFWDGEISKMDGILPQTDCHTETPQPLPRPDNMINDVEHANSSYSSLDRKSPGKRMHFEDDKIAIDAAPLGANSLSHICSRHDWNADKGSDKVDKKNMLLKSREVDQNKAGLQGRYALWSDYTGQIQQSECHPSVAQSFTSVTHHQDRLVGEGSNLSSQCGSLENPHFLVSGSLLPLDSAGDKHQCFPTCNIDYQVPSKQPYGHNVGVAPRKFQHLNPQEKIEKLKRRQQMQAMLAIEMQQRQFNEQMNHVNGSHLNGNYAEGRKSIGWADPITPVGQENMPQTSAAGHGSSVTETTVFQLGSVIAKLDDNLKICMRDSLFRLAKSVSRRMSPEDRSSMNINGRYEDKVAPEAMDVSHLRLSNSPNSSEAETNQIDRIVAMLLFNRHPENVSNLINKIPPRYLTRTS